MSPQSWREIRASGTEPTEPHCILKCWDKKKIAALLSFVGKVQHRWGVRLCKHCTSDPGKVSSECWGGYKESVEGLNITDKQTTCEKCRGKLAIANCVFVDATASFRLVLFI